MPHILQRPLPNPFERKMERPVFQPQMGRYHGPERTVLAESVCRS